VQNRTIKIATRGSDLALYQANHTRDKLIELGHSADIQIYKTQGDIQKDLSFDKIEGKGFFTKEIEDAILTKDADIAVHSLKDLPTEPTPGLALAAIPDRADHRDWLIIHKDAVDTARPYQLAQNATIGTSSIRRSTIMSDLRPDVKIAHLRGNVPTRLQKLREGQYDAIIMAGAGISRLELDLTDFAVWKFDAMEFPSAPAQGAIVIQCRADDIELRTILMDLHQGEIAECSNLDRMVLKRLEGGCHLPFGMYTFKDENKRFQTHVAFGQKDGLQRLNYSRTSYIGLVDDIIKDLAKT